MSTPLLEIRDLKKYFPVARNPFAKGQIAKAVDGIDFRLNPAETLGIAGESGCGKSTVARMLMRLIPPTSGEILYQGQPVAAMDKSELFRFRKDVQMIFQDPFSSLNPRMRVGDIIAEPFIIHKLATNASIKVKVQELMERVGLLPDHYHRYPHEFSGGQRQRIGIARALAVSPKVLIADEPVSALDISIQAQIINLLLELQQEFSLSYIFISHDLSIIRHLCSRVAVMYLGKIVELGSREALFNRLLHPYTEALLSAAPKLVGSPNTARILLQGDIPSPIAPPSGCTFHPRCPYAQERCKTETPQLNEYETGHQAACHFSLELFRSGR